MAMHQPPHPGVFIWETYMEPFGLSCRFLAEKLAVAPSTLNRILKQQSGVSPEMAIRLSIALGRSAESWLAMQANYDLWQVERHFELGNVQKIELSAA
tara:strand:+ start:164 stop:457 length:294 start_codon:yes stop_codon:yes gene_type:complete